MPLEALVLLALGNERTLVTCKSCANKKVSQFFSHMPSVFHWKIFATVFLCFIAGECHGSVNIALTYLKHIPCVLVVIHRILGCVKM